MYNPGSTKSINTTFRANTQTTEGYLIDIGETATSNGFSLIANSFISVTTNTPSGNIVVGEITEYKFTIVLQNAIPSTGGTLVITFPSEIAVQLTGSCTAVISSISHVCTHSHTDNTVTATFNSDAAIGSSLVVTIINGVKNPTVGLISSPLTFESTVTESGTTYDIDEDLTTVTILPTTYGTLTNTSVTRVNSSLINTETELDIQATSANPILANSIVTVEYPLDQVQLNVATTSLLTFFQLTSGGAVSIALTPLSVTSNSTYIVAKFTEWCSSGGVACSEGSENIKFRTLGFKNPTSTLPPSNSFKIFVDTSASLKIDSIEASLFATPTIQAGPLTDVTIVRDSNVTGASTTFTIGFTTTNALTETNGIFLSFTPPSGFLFEGSSLSCTYESADASTG